MRRRLRDNVIVAVVLVVVVVIVVVNRAVAINVVVVAVVVVVHSPIAASEAAPCPLQPCYFDKWDLFAATWDCQYAMGFPVCIFKYLGVSLHNFIPIIPIS